MLRPSIAPRGSTLRAWHVCAVATLASAFLAGALSGCGAREPVQAVHAPRCIPINGATPIDLAVTAPGNGPVRFLVEQRGISVISTLRSADSGKRKWLLAAS